MCIISKKKKKRSNTFKKRIPTKREKLRLRRNKLLLAFDIENAKKEKDSNANKKSH
jgi:hypothetical protein